MIKLCAFADESSPALEGQIKALKRNNIEYLEIRNVNGKNVKDFTVAEAKEYQKQLSDNGLSVWSIGSPLGKELVNINMGSYMDVVKYVYELANIFNTQNVRVFSFYEALNDRQRVIDNLNVMQECAKKYNVKLCHENERGIYGDVPERILDILDNVKGLEYVYDPANFILSGVDPKDSMPKLSDLATYFHIKDAVMKTEEIVPSGFGDGKILDIINRISDEKVLTLEPHLKVFEGYSQIDKAEMKNKFTYPNNETAFDVAVNSLKDLIIKAGYREVSGGFNK